MDRLWNPWLKPRVYPKPTNIEKDNKKRDREAVEKAKRLRVHLNRKIQHEDWDALAK